LCARGAGRPTQSLKMLGRLALVAAAALLALGARAHEGTHPHAHPHEAEDEWGGAAAAEWGEPAQQAEQLMEEPDAFAQRNARAAARFLETFSTLEGVIKLEVESDIYYRVLESGPDRNKKPGLHSLCRIDYKLMVVTDGQGPVETDSSIKRGEPLLTEPDKMIAGWKKVLVAMAEGDKWEVAIPPELGYGAGGAGEAIPPNSALIFSIHLLAVDPEIALWDAFMRFLNAPIQGLPMRLKAWQGVMLCVYVFFRVSLAKRQQTRLAAEHQLKREVAAKAAVSKTVQAVHESKKAK
jgi:FKBP-type peptidyl-prolyl cis-trans isomerase FklB